MTFDGQSKYCTFNARTTHTLTHAHAHTQTIFSDAAVHYTNLDSAAPQPAAARMLCTWPLERFVRLMAMKSCYFYTGGRLRIPIYAYTYVRTRAPKAGNKRIYSVIFPLVTVFTTRRFCVIAHIIRKNTYIYMYTFGLCAHCWYMRTHQTLLRFVLFFIFGSVLISFPRDVSFECLLPRLTATGRSRR